MVSINQYSPSEERINVLSHGLGFLLSLLGTYFLIAKGIKVGTSVHLWSYGVFCSSLLAVYAASTLYHNAKDDVSRRRLKVFDHAAIYYLIAGTNIPIALVGIGGEWGWIITVLVAVLGLIGVILKFFFTGQYKMLSTLSYVLMGCVVFISTKTLIASLSREALELLLAGSLSYFIGAILYSIKKIPYNHAIFHIFVLAGSAAHYLAILWYI